MGSDVFTGWPNFMMVPLLQHERLGYKYNHVQVHSGYEDTSRTENFRKRRAEIDAQKWQGPPGSSPRIDPICALPLPFLDGDKSLKK